MKTYKDVFAEELVVRQRPITVALLKVGMVILGVVLVIAFYFLGGWLLGSYGNSVFPMLFTLVCIGEYFGFRYLGVEYEYSFYSGEVDVDKIVAKRKRTTVLSFKCRDIELMAPYSEKYDGQLSGAKTVDARGSGAGERDWFALISPESGEKSVLAFSPSERMLDAFRQYVRSGKIKDE